MTDIINKVIIFSGVWMVEGDTFSDELSARADRSYEPVIPAVGVAPVSVELRPQDRLHAIREAHLAHTRSFEGQHKEILAQCVEAGWDKIFTQDNLGQIVTHLAKAKAIMADHNIGIGRKLVLR